jgi:hypothetical protein
VKINVISRFAWLKGCLATTVEGDKGSELIVDIIPMSLWGGASTIARYEPQTSLNPLKRFVQKSIINS